MHLVEDYLSLFVREAIAFQLANGGASVLLRKYVEKHGEMVAVIKAGDADLADRLAARHAAQIVGQIQTYLSRDMVSGIKLSGDQH